MPVLNADQILQRSEILRKKVSPCVLCPRQCRALRLQGEKGFCGMTDAAVLSDCLAHFGEEPPISGRGGSGTVFLSGCNAACLFCQNYQISRLRMGRAVSSTELAEAFLKLQDQGCVNINWVTPTPHLPFLVEALALAVACGLKLPVVYNTNGYDRVEILRLLSGVVDVYLPDMKYGENRWAESFSQMPGYVEISFEAVREMLRQVGPLELDSAGTARRGVLIRHLVLPEDTASSRLVFQRIAQLGRIPVSIMAQYKPCFEARKHPVLNRGLYPFEYREALKSFEEAGLSAGYIQDLKSLDVQDSYFPDFSKDAGDIFGRT
ncbi:MAG: radical SAM protein [Desulfobacterales bacterium]|nr:radical SAM protein [Desulfobacterales bacterium]MDD3950901.1 radical SAM protein [Desulfobacterales bacterium]MDD4464275.1 radical SAM protein [Desulfobacterales bacterium]